MENNSTVRKLMGNRLRYLHSGAISPESTTYELQNEETVPVSIGFPAWIFTSRLLRSLKLYFNEKIDQQSISGILSIIRQRFLSGSLCELECCVLVICQHPLSKELLNSIFRLQTSISTACKLGKVQKLDEITISYNSSNSYFEGLPTEKNFVKNMCPQLKVLDKYSSIAIFSASTDLSFRFESLCFLSLKSLDLSEAIASMVADSDQQLEFSCRSLVSYLSRGSFPSLTEVSINCPGPDLDYNTDILLYFIIACADYYYCDTYINGFFGLQICTFEIDVRSLDASEHFFSSQAWADLVRRYDPLIGTNDLLPSNKGGLFPALEILRCNHWLPSGLLFRLFCGSKRGTDLDFKRRLHLEISPGAEDPCFSSILVNTWHPEELHIHTLLIRRKRRLIHGMITHFCNTEMLSDSLNDVLDLDEFHDAYVVEDEGPLSNEGNSSDYCQVVNSALYRAMRDGKLAGVRELGILEDYLHFLGCFHDSTLDENIVNAVMFVFKSCLGLKVLRIYFDNEQRNPTTKDRSLAVIRALLVFLSGLALCSLSINEKQQESQKETTSHLSDSPLSQEDKQRQGYPMKIETVVIDIPGRTLYLLLRAHFLDIMESLSLPKGDKTKNDLRGKAGENEDVSYVQNRQSFIVRIEYGSCQSHSFKYICNLKNEYLKN